MNFKMSTAGKIVGLAALVAAPILFLFQNAAPPTYDPVSVFNYYQTQLEKCVVTDHRLCPGQFTEYTYTNSVELGVPVTSPAVWFPDNRYNTRYARPIAQKVIYRDQGLYVTNNSNFDLYSNPQTVQEYSYAYNPTLGKLQAGPLRSATSTYYTNTTAIPSNPEGLTYNVIDKPATKTTAGVGTTSTNYLATGLPYSVFNLGIETDFTYDSNGNLQTRSEWRDGVKMTMVTYTNYKNGIAQTLTKPYSEIETQVVNPDGTIASKSDALTNKISYLYDQNFRVKQITPPINAITTVVWPDERTKVETRGSHQVTTSSDAFGRTIQVADKDTVSGEVIVATTSYDLDGRVNFNSLPGVTSASAFGTSYLYDVLNRPTTITLTSNNAVTTGYYSAPDTTKIVRPTGEATIYKFLNYGSPNEHQLIEKDENLVVTPVSGADTIVSTFKRDPLGKILEVNQSGVIRQFIYDSNGRISQVIDPERAPVTYTYYV